MRTALLLAAVMCALMLAAATSRSDVAPSAADPMAEPTTNAPIVPAPGNEQPQRDPFSPYETGPGTWRYGDLKPAERAVVDRGRDTTGWDRINAGFAAATRERAQQAAGAASAAQLGVDHLPAIGVVP